MVNLADGMACLQSTSHEPCRRPFHGENNGTYSITSVGGVASTFLLEWFKKLELARQHHHDCASLSAQLPPGATEVPCGCAAIAADHPLHLVSCHVDDDGIFKHLADPAALNQFGRHHRAVYVVGDPIDAIASVFRRRFQCWHMYRLQNCWFTRAQRNGLIPCEQARGSACGILTLVLTTTRGTIDLCVRAPLPTHYNRRRSPHAAHAVHWSA